MYAIKARAYLSEAHCATFLGQAPWTILKTLINLLTSWSNCPCEAILVESDVTLQLTGPFLKFKESEVLFDPWPNPQSLS